MKRKFLDSTEHFRNIVVIIKKKENAIHVEVQRVHFLKYFKE